MNLFLYFSILSLSVSLSSVAQELPENSFQGKVFEYTEDSDCALKRWTGKEWVQVDQDQIRGKSFKLKPFPNFSNEVGAFISGAWYAAPSRCFRPVGGQVSAPTLSETKIQSEEVKDVKGFAPARKKENADLQAEREGKTRLWFEVFGGKSVVYLGKDAKAETVDDSGLILAGEKLESGTHYGLRAGFHLNSQYSFYISAEKWGAQRSGTLSGTGTGTYLETHSIIPILLGTRWQSSPTGFRFFYDIHLGLNSMTANQDLIFQTPVDRTFTVKSSALSLGYGLSVGALYSITDQLGFSLSVRYLSVSASKMKVTESTLTGVDKDDDLGTLEINPVSVLFGLRFEI